MPTEAHRKASERARKRALGLRRHEFWLEPAPRNQYWKPVLFYRNPVAAAIEQFAGKRKKGSKR